MTLLRDKRATCEAEWPRTCRKQLSQAPGDVLFSELPSTALLTGALLMPAVAHSEMEHGPKPATDLRMVNSSSK